MCQPRAMTAIAARISKKESVLMLPHLAAIVTYNTTPDLSPASSMIVSRSKAYRNSSFAAKTIASAHMMGLTSFALPEISFTTA